jgi:REP element-mobilizing transposase RayT
MRPLRVLRQAVWYEIRTQINNREPLFRRGKAIALFARVFQETTLRFAFEVRGLHIVDDWLTFYIKPADGLALPAIMKWLKQVFAQRYNRVDGRIGHIWGDRYGSRILEGAPPVEEEAAVSASTTGVRPQGGERAAGTAISSLRVRPQGRKWVTKPAFPPVITPAPA